MNLIKLKSILLLIFIGTQYALGQSQSMPKNAEIFSKLNLVTNYSMKKWASPAQSKVISGVSYTSNIWSQAVYFSGILAYNQVQPTSKKLSAATSWAEYHKWSILDSAEVNYPIYQAAGQPFIELFLLDKTKQERISGIKASIDAMLASHRIDDWTTTESIYLTMPLFASLGQIYKNDDYHEKMFQMFAYAKNVEKLYSDQEFLWYFDRTFAAPFKTPNGQNCFWARGNGFVIAALAKVLDILPSSAPHYDEYLDSYREMMIAFLNLQRVDGFWNPSLIDAKHFGGKELTGTALITYAMALGVRKGIIDKTTFSPLIAKAMRGMLADGVQKNGALAYVQVHGKGPGAGQPITIKSVSDLDDFAAGCILLAGTEVVKLNNLK
jgi:unsaturated rhamnogalacturonyl hydrolase